MSAPAAPNPLGSLDRLLGGTSRLAIGFVIGALFALLPMSYFYMARDGGNFRGGADRLSESPAEGGGVETALASRDSKPFASRMTYELRHVPQERPAPVAKAAPPPPPPPAPAVVIARPAPIAPPAPPAPVAEQAPAERIANARPISVQPPEPRDRTREIEKEATKPEYREPVKQAKAAAPGPVPAGRVIEGRDIDVKALKLPETPTRPIVAGAGGNMRAEIEAERTVVARAPSSAAEAKQAERAATPIAGVTPITRAAEASRAEPAATAAKPAASESVAGALQVTREWLTASAPTTHTIQLMGTNSEEQLSNHLKSLGKVLDPTKLHVFRTMAQGKPSITVVYGAYPDRQSALQALEKLPPSIVANKPVLRTVNGIRAEQKQHKTDS